MANKTRVNTAELGSAIRRRREQERLSLRDVADETGVSASTLSRIENGTGESRRERDGVENPYGQIQRNKHRE